MTDPVRRLARLAVLLAMATVIHTVEALLPVTVLWFMFGFANIIGLATLCLFGFRDALVLTLGRIVLGSLATGQFGSPAFILSLAGGMSGITAMGLVWSLTGRTGSPNENPTGTTAAWSGDEAGRQNNSSHPEKQSNRGCSGALFSEIGLSIIGAVCHNLGQLAAAYLVLVRSEGIVLLLPFMWLVAVGTGFVNGLAARFVVERVRAASPR